jgi:hypothetical protein
LRFFFLFLLLVFYVMNFIFHFLLFGLFVAHNVSIHAGNT